MKSILIALFFTTVHSVIAQDQIQSPFVTDSRLNFRKAFESSNTNKSIKSGVYDCVSGWVSKGETVYTDTEERVIKVSKEQDSIKIAYLDENQIDEVWADYATFTEVDNSALFMIQNKLTNENIVSNGKAIYIESTLAIPFDVMQEWHQINLKLAEKDRKECPLKMLPSIAFPYMRYATRYSSCKLRESNK